MNLHEQYRPRQWADVAGQDDAVASIRQVLSRGWGGRAFWLTGASGTGKTTLAKLIAAEGAAELCVEEHTAGDLTPKGVRELEAQTRLRPLPIGGKSGWALIVNECHGLRKDTVRALLDVLERLPGHVVWIFTTTRQGQASLFEDDRDGDAAPLVSRCTEVELADGPAVRQALARRAKQVAVAAGCDGYPDGVYALAIEACRGNLRQLLQRVESGQLKATAAAEATAYLKKPLKLQDAARRDELLALMKTLEV